MSDTPNTPQGDRFSTDPLRGTGWLRVAEVRRGDRVRQRTPGRGVDTDGRRVLAHTHEVADVRDGPHGVREVHFGCGLHWTLPTHERLVEEPDADPVLWCGGCRRATGGGAAGYPPPERQYVVTWAIDVSAPSAEAAARKAWMVARRPGSTASVFTVHPTDGGPAVTVDVLGLDVV